jgi:hypothetical protein
MQVTAAQYKDVGIDALWKPLCQVHGWSVPEELEEPRPFSKKRSQHGSDSEMP